MRYIVATNSTISSDPKVLGVYRQEGTSIIKVSEINLTVDTGWTAAPGSSAYSLSPDGKTLIASTLNATDFAVQNAVVYEREGDVFIYKGAIQLSDPDMRIHMNVSVSWSGDSKRLAVGYYNASRVSTSPFIAVLQKREDGVWDVLTPDIIPASTQFLKLNADGTRLVQASTSTSPNVYSVSDVALTWLSAPTLPGAPLNGLFDINENTAYFARNSSAIPILVDTVDLTTFAVTTISLPLNTGDTMSTKNTLLALPSGLVLIATGSTSNPRNVVQASWPYTALATAADVYQGFYPGKLAPAPAYHGVRAAGENAFFLVTPSLPSNVSYSNLQEWQTEAATYIYTQAVLKEMAFFSRDDIKISRTIVEPTARVYKNRLDDLVNQGANEVKMMLVTAPFTFRETDSTVSDAIAGAAEISGNGWPVGGPIVTGIAIEEAGGLTRVVADSTGALASGGSISASKALIYDSTRDIPLVYIDLVSTLTADAGERFSLEFDVSGIASLLPM